MFEFLAVLATGAAAISIVSDTLSEDAVAIYSRVVFVAAIAFGVLAEMLGCYDVDAQFSLRRAWQRIATSWITVALFLITLGFLLKSSESVSRGWALGWFAGGGLTLLALRSVSTLWVRRLKTRGTFNQRVAIFGAGPQGARFAEYVQAHDRLTISLIGFFDDRRDGRIGASAANVPVLGNLSALISMIRDGRIDQVVVALPWAAEDRLQQVVSRLALTPVKIRLAPDLASFVFAKRPLVMLGEMPMMTLFERPISGIDAAIKSAEDIVLPLIILFFIWPILLAIAIAIKLDSPGPVFFRQPREGFNNSLSGSINSGQCSIIAPKLTPSTRPAATIRVSRGSAASCARPALMNCHRSSTCCRGICRSSARVRTPLRHAPADGCFPMWSVPMPLVTRSSQVSPAGHRCAAGAAKPIPRKNW